jgi:hypothetical protein
VACSGGSGTVGISSGPDVFSNGIHIRITKQKAKLGCSNKMVGRYLQAARQTEFPTRFLGILQTRLNSEIESGKPADYQYWSEQAEKRAHSSRTNARTGVRQESVGGAVSVIRHPSKKPSMKPKGRKAPKKRDANPDRGCEPL